jgi:hypothetical protein
MSSVADNAVSTLLIQGEILCVVPQNLIEFWAVATRPLSNNGLELTIDQAQKEIAKLKTVLKLLPDSPNIFNEWENLVIQHSVIGKPTHDARLVAAMNVHKLTHLLTFNIGDFKRFTSITPVDPSSV